MVMSLGLVITLFCATLTPALPLNSPLLASYDYIVVGGGPSGLTMANRLSEDPTVNVLLLEAGPADQGEQDVTVPAMVSKDVGTKYDWNLSTVPQTYLDGRARSLPQGHALGGGTILNAMLWNRGGMGDYNDWEQLGNPGWEWSDILPYFMKSETYTPVYSSAIAEQFSIQEDMSIHGFSGPVNVGFSKYFYNSTINLFNALAELGIPTAYDPNAGNIAGASFLPTDIDPNNQWRSDARIAYYDPYVSRPNLWVSTGQTVTSLLFSAVPGYPGAKTPRFYDRGVSGEISFGVGGDTAGEMGIAKGASSANGGYYRSGISVLRRVMEAVATRFRVFVRQTTPQTSLVRAVGVEFAPDATSPRQNVSATREVILSAGAIHSPHLLILSGIGPAAVLEALQVPVIVNLPGVGNNLQDHFVVNTFYPYRNTSYVYPSELVINATWNSQAEADYLANRTGPWTEGSPDGVAFPSLPHIVNEFAAITDAVNAQLASQYLIQGLDASVVAGYAAQLPLLVAALSDSTRAAFEIINNNAGNLAVATMRPLSRGVITLNSTMPFDPPLIDPRYGSNPVDLEILLQALLFNRRILATDSMQWLDPEQLNPPIDADDDWIIGMMKDGASSECHPSGTCAMMPLSIGGVVSSDLIVYGTQNLRVVDASIMPLLPASHLQAVMYGIAEKAADIVKAAWPSVGTTTSLTIWTSGPPTSNGATDIITTSRNSSDVASRTFSSSSSPALPTASTSSATTTIMSSPKSSTVAESTSLPSWALSSPSASGAAVQSTFGISAASSATTSPGLIASSRTLGAISASNAIQALTLSSPLAQSVIAYSSACLIVGTSAYAENSSISSFAVSISTSTKTSPASICAARTRSTASASSSSTLTTLPPAPAANAGPPIITSYVTVVYTQYVYS